jgi:hypothetical protein
VTTDTIAEQVSTMHAGMDTQPQNEIMGASAREHADPAAQGISKGVAATSAGLPDIDLLDAHGTSTTLCRATGGPLRRHRQPPSSHRVLSGRLVPLLQPRPHHLPGPPRASIGRTRRGLIAVSPQPADESLRMQQINGLAFPVYLIPATLRPGSSVSSARRRLRPEPHGSSLASMSPPSTPMARPQSQCPPPSSSMPATRSAGSTSILNNFTRSEPAAILAALDAAGL